MMQQAIDFREESAALFNLLSPQDDAVFSQTTQFKEWTVNDVIGHLHLWNYGADLSLRDPESFQLLLEKVLAAESHRSFTRSHFGSLNDRSLFETWYGFVQEMSDRFGEADPDQRVKWAGPDMSVRMSITARHMETWAHGQAIYDLLGVERVNTDRIKNVATLGVKTFGWTFANRGEAVPDPAPYVRLTAPSGALWEWNDEQPNNRVDGDAVGFCQTVTQSRNVSDTNLTMTGDVAKRWMETAQCFAGPAEDPPKPGLRHLQ